MAIEPCGHPQAVVVLLRVSAAHFPCRLQPSLVSISLCHLHYAVSFLQFLVAPASHPCTQMRCLHSARSAACDHQESLLGQMLAQRGYAQIDVIGARQTMSAHHALQLVLVIVREHLAQAVAYAVVVHRACQCFLDVARVLSHLYIMPIYAPVIARLIALWIVG